MSRERWRAIARVEKTHGRRGEVVTRPVHGLPALLREGLEVALVPPGLTGPRRVRVERCADGPHGQLVALGGVRGLSESAPLQGKTVLARAADLPAGWELADADGALGVTVRDARLGTIGCVQEVLAGTAAPVWVVRGERGEVLVPAVADLVREFDPVAGVASCELPVGLAPWDEG